MDSDKSVKIKNSDMANSFVALKRAAKIARQIAIQTRTGIVIRRGSEIVYVSAEELEKEQFAADQENKS